MSIPGWARARNRLIGGVLAAVLLPCGVAAEEMVPADVVLELVKTAPRYVAGDPSLLVGAAPDGLSELLALPEGFEVLASLVWDEASAVIGASELAKAQLGGQLEAGLIEHGWSRYRKEASADGFQPSADDKGLVFCGEEGDILVVELESKSADETRARLRHQAGKGYSVCGKMARIEQMEEVFGRDVPFPTLHPPDGAKSEGSAGGAASDFRRSASTHLETDLAPAEILVHYANQLGGQGWQPDARIEYESLAYQSWLFLDESGKEWHALLMVKTSPRDDARREVELAVDYLGRD